MIQIKHVCEIGYIKESDLIALDVVKISHRLGCIWFIHFFVKNITGTCTSMLKVMDSDYKYNVNK
jgi:hypothetical protein